MRSMALNIEGVRRSKEAAVLLRTREPDMVGYLHAHRARPWLAWLALRHGYYRHHAQGGQELANICLFLKKDPDLEILSVRQMHMEEDWIGGKAGHHHDPRSYWVVVARKRGGPIQRTIFVHFPTDNSPRAQEESKDRIVAYHRRHLDDDFAVIGDLNEEVHEVRSFARRLEGELHTVGKVDHGIFSEGRNRVLNRTTRLVVHSTSLRRWMQEGAHGWGMYSWYRAKISR